MQQSYSTQITFPELETADENILMEFFAAECATQMPSLVAPRKGVNESILNFSKSLQVSHSNALGVIASVNN
jgi:hypothetical protein